MAAGCCLGCKEREKGRGKTTPLLTQASHHMLPHVSYTTYVCMYVGALVLYLSRSLLLFMTGSGELPGQL